MNIFYYAPLSHLSLCLYRLLIQKRPASVFLTTINASAAQLQVIFESRKRYCGQIVFEVATERFI